MSGESTVIPIVPVEGDHQPSKLLALTGRLSLAALALTGAAFVFSRNSNQSSEIKHLQQQQAQTAAGENQMAQILAIENNVGTDIVNGSALKSVKSLPEYGEKVSSKLQKELEDSSVELIYRPKNSSAPWTPWCSATKVSDRQSNYILAANHCFKFQEDLPTKGGGPDTLPDAINIESKTTYDFAVTYPRHSIHNRTNNIEPIAFVGGIAVDESGDTDLALLSTIGVKNVGSYPKLPAISLNRMVDTDNAAASKRGQSVDIYSTPDANDFHSVKGTGIYLGNYAISQFGFSQKFNLVATNPSSVTKDACFYGASGSSAVLADGKFLGPLTLRSSVGYDSNTLFYGDDTRSFAVSSRLLLSQTTHLNLSDYTTICAYSTPYGEVNHNVNYVDNTIDDLIDVLNNPGTITYPSSYGGKSSSTRHSSQL